MTRDKIEDFIATCRRVAPDIMADDFSECVVEWIRSMAKKVRKPQETPDDAA